MKHTQYSICSLALALFAISVLNLTILTTSAQAAGGSKTGLPLPRFVSLKSSQVNMRVGPGKEFQVVWKYLKKGLPMEIIQEFDNWRKVRDPQGNEGWILHSLLSGKRMIIVSPWESDKITGQAMMFAGASENSQAIAKVEPGVVGEVYGCELEWCRLRMDDIDGYISKLSLWGVYPDELIEE